MKFTNVRRRRATTPCAGCGMMSHRITAYYGGCEGCGCWHELEACSTCDRPAALTVIDGVSGACASVPVVVQLLRFLPQLRKQVVAPGTVAVQALSVALQVALWERPTTEHDAALVDALKHWEAIERAAQPPTAIGTAEQLGSRLLQLATGTAERVVPA